MSKVGFIGVGTMGCPMASNIISKGNDLKFYDPYVNEENKSKLENLGAQYCTSIKDLLDDSEFVITMLPNGNNVKDVCLGEGGLLKQEKKDFDFLNEIFTNLPENVFWLDIISYLINNPLLQIKNSNIISNEGAIDKDSTEYNRYDKSNKLFKRAIKTVPLGSQTFSKSHIQFPNGATPLFFDRAQ